MADLTFKRSLTRPPPTSEEIESILRDRVASGSAVGVAAGIVTTAGQSVTASFGTRRAGEDEPVAATTAFEIGSLTKLFTATVLADLAVRGRVALQDPVAAFLPPTVHLPARSRDITLVDLATHTSGLPRLPTNLAGADTADLAAYTAEDLYAFLSEYRLSRDVGSQYEYSNLGYVVLGHVLSLIEHLPLPDLLRDRILRPLEMTSTGYAPADRTRHGFAAPHDERRRPVPAWPTPRLGGAGGLLSTLPDLLRFAAAGLRGVPGELQNAMALAKTPSVATAPRRGANLGWHSRRLVDHDVFWHSGETAGSRACIVLDDTTGLAAAVLSNCVLPIEDIPLHLLDARRPLTPPTQGEGELQLPPALLDRYVGVYQLEGGGTVTVTRSPDGLTAAATGLGSAPLHARSPTEFFVRVVPVSVTFELDPDADRATGLVLHYRGEHIPANRAMPAGCWA